MNSASLIIRPGVEGDAHWLAEQDKIFAKELTASGISGIQPSCLTADVIKKHGFGLSPFFHTLIAEMNSSFVGYIIYTQSYDTGRASMGFELIDIFVRPENRKSQVAASLLEKLKKICHEKGGSFIKWKFETENTEAIKFYKKIGAAFPAEERLGYLWF